MGRAAGSFGGQLKIHYVPGSVKCDLDIQELGFLCAIQFTLKYQFLLVIVFANKVVVVSHGKTNPCDHRGNENHEVDDNRVWPGVAFHKSVSRADEGRGEGFDAFVSGIDADLKFCFSVFQRATIQQD